MAWLSPLSSMNLKVASKKMTVIIRRGFRHPGALLAPKLG